MERKEGEGSIKLNANDVVDATFPSVIEESKCESFGADLCDCGYCTVEG